VCCGNTTLLSAYELDLIRKAGSTHELRANNSFRHERTIITIILHWQKDLAAVKDPVHFHWPRSDIWLPLSTTVLPCALLGF
jgi:hypothetical protein